MVDFVISAIRSVAFLGCRSLILVRVTPNKHTDLTRLMSCHDIGNDIELPQKQHGSCDAGATDLVYGGRKDKS